MFPALRYENLKPSNGAMWRAPAVIQWEICLLEKCIPLEYNSAEYSLSYAKLQDPCLA